MTPLVASTSAVTTLGSLIRDSAVDDRDGHVLPLKRGRAGELDDIRRQHLPGDELASLNKGSWSWMRHLAPLAGAHGWDR